jgi:hypothetical protein
MTGRGPGGSDHQFSLSQSDRQDLLLQEVADLHQDRFIALTNRKTTQAMA